MNNLVHLESLVKMLNDLKQDNIELFSYHLHPQAFESFELVLGKTNQQVKFLWDGKESTLSLYFATIQNQNSNPEWIHEANFSLPNGEGLYEEIWSECNNMFEN